MYKERRGFELLVATAYYLEWPQRTTVAISKAISSLKPEDINRNCQNIDFSV
jgi:hypothetical protein